MTAREKAASTAKAWLGRKESDGSHKTIIDTYNSISPLPGGYRMTYSDPWCAAFVSAVGKRAGTPAILPECSCERMIRLYQQAGGWVEDDSYTPQVGDLVFYDWQDSGAGDNKGEADHVGIVVDVNGSVITVVEGNKSDAVGTRILRVNGQYIRGYAVPAYDEQPSEEPTTDPGIPAPQYHGYVYAVLVNLLKPGNRGPQVWDVQQLLNAHGFECKINGVYDTDTVKAVKAFQKAAGIEQDGEFGGESFAKLWNWRQT